MLSEILASIVTWGNYRSGMEVRDWLLGWFHCWIMRYQNIDSSYEQRGEEKQRQYRYYEDPTQLNLKTKGQKSE